MKIIFAWLFLGLSSLLFNQQTYASDEKIFLANQSFEIRSAIIKALEIRQWQVYVNTEAAIKAKVHSNGRRTTADITIYHRDGNIYYTAVARKMQRISMGVGKFRHVEVDTEVPEFWINNLRQDVLNIKAL
ncbi:hypothetical protein TDB9533_03444 [Thalassocella blandensis]|nr:hypothetical protein TDB9533_03444 [Thalassocella blandensis]